MKILARLLIGLIAAGALLVLTINWIAPTALSFYSTYKAPKVARQLPRPLTDTSVSQAIGSKLALVGYEFEVPWADVDDSLTKLYPEKSADKTLADLHFRSGLRMMVTAGAPGTWVRGIPETMKISSQQAQRVFGGDAMKSDYDFVRELYEFNPATMEHWAPSAQAQVRQQAWLILKSLALLKSAETGIFVLTSPSLRGFQEGDPTVRQDGIALHLFSEKGSVEFIVFQKDYKKTTGVTQAELNRIVQTTHPGAQPDANGAKTPDNTPVESRSDAIR
jgi:hypothetical protein